MKVHGRGWEAPVFARQNRLACARAPFTKAPPSRTMVSLQFLANHKGTLHMLGGEAMTGTAALLFCSTGLARPEGTGEFLWLRPGPERCREPD